MSKLPQPPKNIRQVGSGRHGSSGVFFDLEWDAPNKTDAVIAYFVRQHIAGYAVEQGLPTATPRARIFWSNNTFGPVSIFSRNAAGISAPAIFSGWVSPPAVAACVAFFSPCDYALPKQHLAKTLEWLVAENTEVILAQVVLPGQNPQPVPPKVKSLVYESPDIMFYKENLWNIAARHTTNDKLLFVDSDVRIACRNIASKVATLLSCVDICQPFETGAWLSRTGEIDNTRSSAASALANGNEPAVQFYHPGFSWAMTRRTFERLNGFYDHNVVGGGDIAFVYALDKRWHHVNLLDQIPNDAQFSTTPRYRRYKENSGNLNLRIGYLSGVTCQHSWHGEVLDRQYTQRGDYCPIDADADFPLTYRPDGLLTWTRTERSAQLKKYFLSRREDG